jgi:septum site-determining protein MinD
MTRVLVVTSGKGGVGKTTCTANLGMALAQRKKRVVVIDADFGLRNLDLLLGLENRIVYTALDVLAGDCTAEKALVKDKRQPNLALIAAAQNRNKEAITPEQMKRLVQELYGKCDIVIIDCPAGIELGFQNAIAAAKEAIVVTTPEISAVRDADRVIGLLEANDVKNTKLLINRLKPAMVRDEQMMSVRDVLDILAVPLLGVVPDDERVIVSSNRGEPLVLEHELSMAGVAFNNVARRLLGEEVPLMDLSAPHDDLFTRLRRFLRGSAK